MGKVHQGSRGCFWTGDRFSSILRADAHFLKIKNVALIDALDIEFGPGLNLLTGETGSGKSIIVDSLGALTGERVYERSDKRRRNVRPDRRSFLA